MIKIIYCNIENNKEQLYIYLYRIYFNEHIYLMIQIFI